MSLNNAFKVIDYYDLDTGTFSYLVADVAAKECIIIDPVLGFDMVSSSTDITPSSAMIQTIKDNEWNLKWILETHAHADHLTSAVQIQNYLFIGDTLFHPEIGSARCDFPGGDSDSYLFY